MKVRKGLLTAASVLSYIGCLAYFIVCTCFYSVNNTWFWLYGGLAVVCLCNGLVITRLNDKLEGGWTRGQIACICIHAFFGLIAFPVTVLCLLALIKFKDKPVRERPVKEKKTAKEKVQKDSKVKAWFAKVLASVKAFFVKIGAAIRSSFIKAKAKCQEKKDKKAENTVNIAKKAKEKQPNKFAVKAKAFFARYKLEPQEKRKVKKNAILASVALAVILFASFCGMLFETAGLTSEISTFRLTKEMTEKYNTTALNGRKNVIVNDSLSYAVTVIKPKSATPENPAPVVMVLPGFTRTKETMLQYAIEYARRGAVAFVIDPGAQGGSGYAGYTASGSQIGSTTGNDGMAYLLQYVYNNTDDYDYIDRERIGLLGHSQGAINVFNAAINFSGGSYEKSVVKALYFSGYIAGIGSGFANFRFNVAMSYALFDEGDYRYITQNNAYETLALQFINNVNGTGTNKYADYELKKGYGNIDDGTYRILFRENTNHCLEMYDKASLGNSIQFFTDTLGLDGSIAADNQIWFGKEVMNGISLAGGFCLIVGIAGLLLATPIFKSVVGKRYEDEAVVVNGQLLQGPSRFKQSTSGKLVFWLTTLLTAIIACLDYIPLTELAIKWLPEAQSGQWTFVFPSRMVNAIMFWAVVNGIIGLIVFFGADWIETSIAARIAKIRGQVYVADYTKYKPLKINFIDFVKTFVLAAKLFGCFYGAIELVNRLFYQDFRFLMVSAGPLKLRHFVAWLMYIPLFFIFYISNSIRVNCGIGFKGWKEWQVKLVGALANSVGLAFMLLIHYAAYFQTGFIYWQYSAKGAQIWLYMNMVFPLVPMMFLLPIMNRIFYNKTNRPYLGAMANCMIFIMMTLASSVNYIPI